MASAVRRVVRSLRGDSAVTPRLASSASFAADFLTLSCDRGFAESVLSPQSSRFTVRGWLSHSWCVLRQSAESGESLSLSSIVFVS